MSRLARSTPYSRWRLLVDRGLRRVQVLGLDAVVLEQSPRAEADDVAGDVADRPEQPAAEPVDQALPTVAGQPGRAQLVVGEAAPAQVLRRGRPTSAGRNRRRSVRRPRASKPRSVRNWRPVRGLAVDELLGVELRRRPVRLDQAGALALLAARRGHRPPRSAAATPARSASRSTASANDRWSSFMTKAMTSPPSPQPKQW